MEEKPLSENIGTYVAGAYIVTAAIWRTSIDGHLYDTFEIGIRHKETNAFKLLQSHKYNHQSVQEMARGGSEVVTAYFRYQAYLK